VILSLLVLALSNPVPPVTAAEEPSRPAFQGEVALNKAVRRIADRVELLRKETFASDPVAVRVPESMREVAAELRAFNVLKQERLAARGRAWADLGLGGPTSPATIFRLLAADLAGVGFDPTQNRLLVGSDKLDQKDFEVGRSADETEAATLLMMTGVRRDEPIFAHMLVHVLQRSRTGRDHLAETTDELLARSAWAEGEANLVAVRYLFAGLGLQEDVVDLASSPGEFLEGRLMPPGFGQLTGVVADMLHFVYVEGYAQATQRFKAGGWSVINGAIRRDVTTRQVLHAGRSPIDAPFPAPSPPFDGLALLDADTLGEQGMIVLFSRLTGKDNLALQVGDGWAGDSLRRWEAPDGAVTEWWTRWESDEDVDDFLYALKRGLPALIPGAELVEATDGRWILDSSDRVVRIAVKSQEVRLMLATGAYAGRLRDSGEPEGGKDR
jgi:hypothetical protein